MKRKLSLIPFTILAVMAATSCAAQSGTSDPIAAAAKGLNAAIEDDVNALDTPMVSMSNSGCITRIIAKERAWDVDWRNAEMVSREDTFIFVKALPVQIAIVADMSVAGQSEKLDELALAIRDVAKRCLPSKKPAKDSETLPPPPLPAE